MDPKGDAAEKKKSFIKSRKSQQAVLKSFLTFLSITPLHVFSHCIHNNTLNVGQQIINCNVRQSLTLCHTKSCHSPTRPQDNVSRDVTRLHHVLPYSSCLARAIFSADMSCHIRLWRCQDDRMYIWGAEAEQNRTRGIIELSKTISVRARPCRVRCRDEETC